MTQRPWAEQLAHGVARELRRHRERRGLSAQELADACAEMGMPMQRSVIANFENGRRASVGVAELLVFAAVLKIPPVWLIAPMGFEESVRILPKDDGDPYAAAMWFCGGNARDGEEEAYGDNPVPLCEDLVFLVSQVADVKAEVEQAKAEAEKAAPELEKITKRLEVLNSQFKRETELQKEILNRVQEAHAEDRSASDSLFSEADALMTRISAASEEISKLLSERTGLAKGQVSLEYSMQQLRRYEGEVREVLDEFKDRGWRPPLLPDEMQYLLVEPVKETLSEAAHRRRRQRK